MRPKTGTLSYSWWFRNPAANQLSLVVKIPIIYKVCLHPRWWSPDFWTINSSTCTAAPLAPLVVAMDPTNCTIPTAWSVGIMTHLSLLNAKKHREMVVSWTKNHKVHMVFLKKINVTSALWWVKRKRSLYPTSNQPTSKASLTSDRLLNLHPSVGWFEVDSLTILSNPTSKVVVYYPRKLKHSTKFLAQIKRWSIGGLGPGGLGF